MSSLLSISPCITAQATAVWLSKEIPEDERYKTSELLGELSLKLHDYIHHKTGADHRIHYYHVQFTAHIYISQFHAGDIKYRANPLVGAPDSMERGVVKEYFSLEMGLIQLQAGHTVLFHLDQVREIVIVKLSVLSFKSLSD